MIFDSEWLHLQFWKYLRRLWGLNFKEYWEVACRDGWKAPQSELWLKIPSPNQSVGGASPKSLKTKLNQAHFRHILQCTPKPQFEFFNLFNFSWKCVIFYNLFHLQHKREKWKGKTNIKFSCQSVVRMSFSCWFFQCATNEVFFFRWFFWMILGRGFTLAPFFEEILYHLQKDIKWDVPGAFKGLLLFFSRDLESPKATG